MTVKGENVDGWAGDPETIAKQALALAKTNESDIDSLDHIVHGIANDTGNAPTLNNGIVTPAKLASYDSNTDHAKIPRVKSDGTGFDFVDLPNVLTRSNMQATVPTTLAGLKISHLSKMSDGTLPIDSTFDMTNSGSADLTIKANTAFATGLTLAKIAKSYDVLDFATGDPYTLSINATGASMAFTTDITIPANGTKTLFVRDNG